jgi:hypothetical protein
LNDLTVQGITAYKAGNRAEAREILTKATVLDPKDVIAWIWLSAAVETNDERKKCLETVLTIDPQNSLARSGLEKLKRQEHIPEYKPDEEELAKTQVEQQTNPDEPIPPVGVGQPKPAEPDQKKIGIKHKGLVITLLVISSVCLCAMLVYVGTQYAQIMAIAQKTAQVKQQTEEALIRLEVTLTPTITNTLENTATPTFGIVTTVAPTITETPTPRPTKTASPTATFPPAGPTVDAQMANIQKKVATIRGLPVKAPVSSFLMPKSRAEELILSTFDTDETRTELLNQQHIWSALGLVKPGYDLVNSALNHTVDGLGGFYLPQGKTVVVLGVWFQGMEQFIFAHEFDHALIDENFDMTKMGLSPQCQLADQACAAAKALVEGDATLLMYQWLDQQYKDTPLYQELLNYHPPLLAISPQEVPPPFIEQDSAFPYSYGLPFVQQISKSGGWTQVNEAYHKLPTTTEQIMHPEKYTAGEGAILVQDATLDSVLGEGWKSIKNDSLGEWMTYMVLGYGVDYAAKMDLPKAQKAAAGWGGDNYQVYYNQSTDSEVLAAHWAWDTLPDSAEFYDALQVAFKVRYNSAPAESQNGLCWQANNSTSCIFEKEEQTLWIVAPDQTTVDKIRALYPLFK